MTTSKVNKTALPLDQYQTYDIDQNYAAFEIVFENVSLEQLDDIEADYYSQGYKIFNCKTERTAEDKFKFSLIIAKMNFIF